MSQSLRFLHASDFHLERPLTGFAETPAHLVDLLIDAPYAAAERVFELAQSERADFLVLAGDIANIDRAGPRAISFLLDQFQRLAARDIAVYWLCGPSERRGPWPAEVTLPGNVRIFPLGSAQPLVHHADGDDLALLLGYSPGKGEGRPEPVAKTKSGRYTIGVSHGKLNQRQVGKLAIDYWACGGPHRRHQVSGDKGLTVYSGSPQGRTPGERGPHGAVVVEVDERGLARPRFVPTDLARYRRIRVEIDPAASRADQERIFANRVQAEFDRAPGGDLFLRWKIIPVGISRGSTTILGGSTEAWGQSWLRWLRQEFGTDSPAAWSISVDVVAPTTRAHDPQDGSLLADFLAVIDEIEESRDALPLVEMLPEGARHSSAADLLQVADARQRKLLLQRARALGADLLGAEELSA
jgi:hypothetical protein